MKRLLSILFVLFLTTTVIGQKKIVLQGGSSGGGGATIDTTGKWVTSTFRRSDSVFYVKGGAAVFSHRDSLGSGSSVSGLSTRVYYLSKNGCVSDADVAYGSTTFGTNNYDSIQAVLNKAAGGTPIIVYVDGEFSTTGNHRIYSNTSIIGVNKGFGFILRNNSNILMFKNSTRSSVDYFNDNINFENITLNFNGYTAGGVANQLKENATTKEWTVGVRFAGVINVSFKGVNFYNSRTFCTFLSKCKNFFFEDIVVKQGGFLNQDGIKFNVVEDGFVRNYSAEATGDDPISFLSNDICWPTYPPPTPTLGQSFFDSSAVYGDVKNIIVDGVTLKNTAGFIRFLSTTNVTDRVFVSNVAGTGSGSIIMDNYSEDTAMVYGITGMERKGYFKSIHFDNIDIAATGVSYKNTLIYLDADMEDIVFNGIRFTDFGSNTYGMSYVGSQGDIRNLVFNNLTYNQTTSFSHPMVDLRGRVENASFSGANLTNTYTDTTSSNLLAIQGAGTFVNLKLNNIYAARYRHIVYLDAGSPGNITAANIYHSVGKSTVFVNTGVAVDTFTLSNWRGADQISFAGTGSVEDTTGDAFPSSSGGTVTSVSGTANRITSTGGTTPVIDVSATFEALLGKVANPLSQFAATTSAQLAGVLSDETGTDKVVFNTSPLFVTPRLAATSTTGFVWKATDAIGNGSWQAGTGVTAIATIGATPNAAGGTISGSDLTLQPASASFGGVVTNIDQEFFGRKSFKYSDNSYNNGVTIQNMAVSATALTGMDFKDNAGVIGGIFQFVPSYFTFAPLANTVIMGSYGTTPVLFVANSSGTGAAQDLRFLTKSDGGTDELRILASGRVGIQTDAPTAWLHLPVGSAAASSGPLKFTTTSAALLTTPTAGSMEVLADELYYTGANGIRNKITEGVVSTAVSLTAGEKSTTIVTATGQTITLPTAVGIEGRIYVIKLTAAGTSTVATTSSQTIDGATTYSLSAQYKYVTVQSNNANWIIIANN